MLTATLAAMLLASATGPVDARLELRPEADQLNLRLCFSSAEAHRLSYQLEVVSKGRAGTSRSRQSGELTSGPETQCPLNNRLGIATDSHIEATVTWSVDGQQQTPLHQTYPSTEPAGSAPPAQNPTPGADTSVVMADSNLR
ncbi:curli-like amyloid fiber formation chaperone CsgH [Stutzerimonas zhaodongensis]|uniref:curli-like amyloid fiber formation chaperone CsgH n=1 Tax=Stutzerimonas TaxID=2901164 RepID=UPI00388D1A9E